MSLDLTQTMKLSNAEGLSVVIPRHLLEERSTVLREYLQYQEVILSNELVLLHRFVDILQLKNFLVENDLQLTSLQNTMDMYRMAKEYRIADLQERCRNYLLSNLNQDNVCQMHEFACFENDRSLQYHCWTMFDNSWDYILSSDAFTKCEPETISRYVSRPMYKTLKELSLFNGILAWATNRYLSQESVQPKASSKVSFIRKMILPYLPSIRFLSMNEDELEQVFSKNILTTEEKRYITTTNGVNRNEVNHNPDIPICPLTLKRTEQCYGLLINYENRYKSDHKIDTYADEYTEFLCVFTPLEDCFLTHVILPVINTNAVNIDNVVVSIVLVACGKRLRKQVLYTASIFGEILIEPPLFLHKNQAVLVRSKTLPSVDIMIFNTQLYINCQRSETGMEIKHLNNRRRFYMKIRVYF
ncbi:uncharacterized protein [Centruroides vittatus]|uniref:uncharacterized protein n=1 Tax=Centruroides vittatus TaxID=120091 RepID=UPI00350F60C7